MVLLLYVYDGGVVTVEYLQVPSLNGSVAEFVGKEGRGKSRYVEKSNGGTFPLRLEIPQRRRDSHFSHRPGDG